MAEPSRRNVLLITVDQWRGDCVGAWGHPLVRTPAIDRLVAEGTSFRRHWANAVPCGPSRASLYTGLYAMNHRSVLNGTPLDARFTNVALEARAAGYEPALFGYTDTSVDPRTVGPDDPRLRTYEGVLPGFDPVCDLPSEPLGPWLDWLAERGHEVDHEHPHRIYDPADVEVPVGRGATWRPARYGADETETAFLTGRALDWLEERARQRRPWFAHVSYLRPHPPYLVPSPWHDAYDPADIAPFVGAPTREAEGAIHPIAAVATTMVGVAGAPEDELDRRQLRATYYGMMGEVDAQLGRLLDGLDELGQADDTLVVLTADHGDLAGDHWLIEKLGWWDEAYSVPMVVRDPTAPPAARGRHVEATTEHVDVTPTVVDWLGRDVPEACDGRSLLPFLSGTGQAPARWRTDAHMEWDFRDPVAHTGEDAFGITMDECGLAVQRGPRWTYVHLAAEALPDLLFDRSVDPHLQHDLVADPDHAGVLADQARRLLSWRMRHADRTHTGTLLGPHGPHHRVDPRVG